MIHVPKQYRIVSDEKGQRTYLTPWDGLSYWSADPVYAARHTRKAAVKLAAEIRKKWRVRAKVELVA